MRSYETEEEVAALIDLLAPDGLHVERWLPKATLGGRVFDLRVVVVHGEPTHAVVRTSLSPMTNLHLGGARGDLGVVRSRLGRTAGTGHWTCARGRRPVSRPARWSESICSWGTG